MTKAICLDDECDAQASARGLCSKHYHRWKRQGVPMPPRMKGARVSEVDRDAMTVTCTIHGKGSRLRVRERDGRTEFYCRHCEGGGSTSRAMRVRWKYGLSAEDFTSLLESQAGKCRICESAPLDNDVLVVDHDHTTGLVRGLLCRSCNLALGYMKDSPLRLVRAAAYLRAAC